MFNKKGGFGGGRKFSGGSRPAYGDERPAMHPATCSTCGNSCEVPFKPNGKKPVFCRDCFHKEEAGESSFERPRAFQTKGAFGVSIASDDEKRIRRKVGEYHAVSRLVFSPVPLSLAPDTDEASAAGVLASMLVDVPYAADNKSSTSYD